MSDFTAAEFEAMTGCTAAEFDAAVQRKARETGLTPRQVALRLKLELDGRAADLLGLEPSLENELALLVAIDEDGRDGHDGR